MNGRLKAAGWRAGWTMAAVAISGGIVAMLSDPQLVADFLAGRNDQIFWRLLAVTFIAGVLNGLKKLVDLKVPGLPTTPPEQ